MKILHIINNLNTGGAEKLLLETLPIYNKEGITVDLLLLNGTKYPFLKELEKQNCCTVYDIGKGSVYNPLLIFKIIPFLRQYDIVHGHIFPTFYWLAFAKIFSQSNTKLVYTEHATTNKRQENRLYKIVDNQIYKIYEKIICISDEIKSILKKHISLKDESFIVIENGVNLSVIKDAKYLKKKEINKNISETDQLLIQVSAFRQQKDQATLIRSMKLLPETIKLLLVGDGELRESNKELVKSLSLEKRVFFLGIRMDVASLLKTSDIVVLSSHYEGLSLSSIEAMASGKPFIASDVLGLHEIVNGAGILFQEGNEIELAEHIKKLLNDSDYYEKIALNCQVRAENYDIKKMVDNYIKLYKQRS